MSSHHIVKEKQEPALYIHALGNFDKELLGQLLEWSPTVIVQEELYELIESLGIKIDVVAGSKLPGDIQEHTIQIGQQNKEIISVINYLIDKGYKAVNIISNDTGYLTIEQAFEEINIVWLNETGKTISVKTGFRLWKPAGTVYSFQFANGLTTTNLKPTGDGVYEVIADGFVSFNFDAPGLFITEHL